jgi:thiosulfate dehydrogenase
MIAAYFPVLCFVAGILCIAILTTNNAIRYYKREIPEDSALKRQFLALRNLRLGMLVLLALLFLGACGFWIYGRVLKQEQIAAEITALLPVFDKNKLWEKPNAHLAELLPDSKLIAYGQELIAHTGDYFGENGSLRPGTINGMNCQNCHLDAGTKPFGNNYSAVQSTYPQMRARSGMLETIAKRVNDCFMRSLNGQAIDTTSREMLAIQAYIKYLGTNVPKGIKPKGAGLVEVPMLERPADPVAGAQIYAAKCASCHGSYGGGLPIPGEARNYPPLWGDKSYNQGAGLFRMSRLAGYVKANMPFGTNYDNPQLSDADAWDVAAFINSQPRPKHPFLDTDWPDISKKPFDHPFGPYKDSFPEAQHKFGPFLPIIAFYKK